MAYLGGGGKARVGENLLVCHCLDESIVPGIMMPNVLPVRA